MRSLTQVLLVVLLNCSVFATPIQWTVESGGNGHWYEIVLVGSSTSWNSASQDAVISGGYLATITSQQENYFVYDIIDSQEYWTVGLGGESVGPWLGGYQILGSLEPDGGWTWVTSEDFVYSNWAEYEPNNYNGREHYLSYFNAISNSMSPMWNDVPNYDQPHSPIAYVVEYIPEPVTIASFLFGGMLLRRKIKP